MFLVIQTKERRRDGEPPEGDQKEIDRDRKPQGDDALRAQQIEDQRDDERNAGADITPGESI